jgi:uncharacterized membrane protein HdeD (DUF308 family)
VSQSVTVRWSLLLLSSLFHATFSFMMLCIWSPDGLPALHTFAHYRSSIQELGLVALAAGICLVVAGLWNARSMTAWLLVLNGLGCSVLGILIVFGSTRQVSFRSLALVIVVMAVSIGTFELATGRTLRGRRAAEWLLAAAGVVSVGFAGVFLGFVVGWVPLDLSPSSQTFHWLGAYFGFSSICLLGLALGDFNPLSADPGIGNNVLPIV